MILKWSQGWVVLDKRFHTGPSCQDACHIPFISHVNICFTKSFFIFNSTLPEIPRTSLVAQTVKCLPTMRETRVRSLGREGPLEKEMATHSSVLSWRIPWMEEPGGLQLAKSQTRLNNFTFTFPGIANTASKQ